MAEPMIVTAHPPGIVIPSVSSPFTCGLCWLLGSHLPQIILSVLTLVLETYGQFLICQGLCLVLSVYSFGPLYTPTR